MCLLVKFFFEFSVLHRWSGMQKSVCLLEINDKAVRGNILDTSRVKRSLVDSVGNHFASNDRVGIMLALG